MCSGVALTRNIATTLRPRNCSTSLASLGLSGTHLRLYTIISIDTDYVLQPSPPGNCQQHQGHGVRRLRRCHGCQAGVRQIKRVQFPEPLSRRYVQPSYLSVQPLTCHSSISPAREDEVERGPRSPQGEFRTAETPARYRITNRRAGENKCCETSDKCFRWPVWSVQGSVRCQ